MKKVMFLVLLLISATCLISETTVNAGTLVNNAVNSAVGAARDSFLRSIGDYFSVPQQQVITVTQRSIPDEQIPVVFYLARQAKVAPATIIELRLNGKSWLDITNRYGFGSEIFYVPVNTAVVTGPPYGHAYGFYKNKPRKEWSKIKLADADIINLVNLKFISEHYKYPPETIIKMRQKKSGFSTINADLEKQKNANKKNAKAAPAKKAKAASGQVKKQNAAPGQAKKQKVDPGQVKKQNAAPGQAKKQNDAPGQDKNKKSGEKQKNNGNQSGHSKGPKK